MADSTDHRSAKTVTKIAAVIEHLHTEGWMGWSHLRMWQQLRMLLETNRDIYEYAPAFFSLTTSAHLDQALLHIMRMLDTHRQAAGIEYLLDLAEQAHDGFPFGASEEVLEQVHTDRARLRELSQHAKAIKSIRDKRLAHFDRAHLTDRARLREEMFEISVEEVETVFETLSDIVNGYDGLMRETEVKWELLGWEDFENIADLCTGGIHEQAREDEALRSRTDK